MAKVALELGELEVARTLLTTARTHVDGSLDPLSPAVVSHQLARLAVRSTPPEPDRAQAFADEALAQLRDIAGDDATRLAQEIRAFRRRAVEGRMR